MTGKEKRGKGEGLYLPLPLLTKEGKRKSGMTAKIVGLRYANPTYADY